MPYLPTLLFLLIYGWMLPIQLPALAAPAQSNQKASKKQLPDDVRKPGRFATNGITIGLEYAPLDNQNLIQSMSRTFAETGLTGMKVLPENISWGKMQKKPDAPIDFSKLDLFVLEYQWHGFTELTLAFKPHSRWGSKDVGLFKARNASPKTEYQQQFRDWIFAVVERYDGDGIEDMPGLRWPIRYYEIGTEFSSYQPEPVEEYLETLKMAYEEAHRAFPDLLVGHAAFLVTPTHMAVDDPADYDSVWAATSRRDKHHDLKDMRAILDRPELFDRLNLHNLGDPYEIEHLMRWLKYEMALRGYRKPVIISDTVPTSYIGWGPATNCKGRVRGVLAHPATEADRCRLAEYFKKLIQKDRKTLNWTRGFIAADHVQRTIIAAEQGVELINLSFVADLPGMTGKIFKGGAGIAAWGGALRLNPWSGIIKEKYPLFYAIRQMMSHIKDATAFQRIDMGDEQARVYRLDRPRGPIWIAWRDPQSVLLPDSGQPSLSVALDIKTTWAFLETVITEPKVETPTRRKVPTESGRLRFNITHTPIYVLPE